MTVTIHKSEAMARDLTLVRVLDAPRALVWRAWTDPAMLAQWWGPDGFTNPVCEIDARPGGKIRIDMRAPDGTVYPMTGIVHEVEEPVRLVLTEVAEDREGNALLNGHTIVTFEEQGEKTKITVQASAVGVAAVAEEMLKGMEPGWTQSLERLAVLVSRS